MPLTVGNLVWLAIGVGIMGRQMVLENYRTGNTLGRNLAFDLRTISVALILSALMMGSAQAQSSSLTLDSASVIKGGTATLNLSLSSPAGSAPASLQWTLAY